MKDSSSPPMRASSLNSPSPLVMSNCLGAETGSRGFTRASWKAVRSDPAGRLRSHVWWTGLLGVVEGRLCAREQPWPEVLSQGSSLGRRTFWKEGLGELVAEGPAHLRCPLGCLCSSLKWLSPTSVSSTLRSCRKQRSI